MKGIVFVFSLICSYILGFTLNKGLSSTNVIKETSEEGIEFLKYDIPFMYTVRLNEIIIIILLTVLICAICSFYYKESKSSLRQILKIMERIIWSELLLFSFIVGTWSDNLLKGEGENRFIYMYNPEILPFSIVIVLLLFIYIWASYQTSEDNCKIEKKSDLYKSRKNLLPIIDGYLGSIGSISIIGDWGIGKSKLIENFFHAEKDKNDKKYSDKYESIIIDVSSYSENKKIISVIQEELVKILTKHKIFKININFVEKVFVENNDFLKSIKNIFFCRDSLIESKENLNEKIEALYTKNKKRIVLCLDNLERLSDVDRIINLLATIDDLTTDNIRKIYIYDKEHMKLIFDEINFENYIEKYSNNFIEVKEVETSEVVKKPERFDSKRLRFILRIDQKLEEIKDEDLKKKIIQKKEEIEKIMTNPRKIFNIEKYISCKEREISQESQMEYRILIELFGEFDLNNIIQRIIFFPELTYSYRIKLEEFQALSEGKLKLENQKTKEEVELEERKALVGNAEEMLQYIDYCKKNKITNEIQPFFDKIQEYEIKSYLLLKAYLELQLKYDINIYIKEKMKILINEDYFSSKSKESTKNAIKITKFLLIKEVFEELKKFIKYSYNDDYLKIMEVLKANPEDMENVIEKNFNIKYDVFFKTLKVKVRELKEKKFIKKSNLKKELLILEELNFIRNKKNYNREEKILNNFFEQAKAKGIEYDFNEIIKVNEKTIEISSNMFEIKEVIKKDNYKMYIKILEKIKNNKIVEELLVEIYLLKERIICSKRIKIRACVNKLKKYYKNN